MRRPAAGVGFREVIAGEAFACPFCGKTVVAPQPPTTSRQWHMPHVDWVNRPIDDVLSLDFNDMTHTITLTPRFIVRWPGEPPELVWTLLL